MVQTNFTYGAQLEARITPPSAPSAPPPAPPTPPPAPAGDVPDGTIPEVLGWVRENVRRARLALDVEKKSERPRSTLIDTLEDIIRDA